MPLIRTAQQISETELRVDRFSAVRNRNAVSHCSGLWYRVRIPGIPGRWSLPVGRGREFLIVLIFTYFIALGGFAHVIAGSGEAWLLALTSEASFCFAIFGFILPVLVGNVIGRTLIFALLAHPQAQQKIQDGS